MSSRLIIVANRLPISIRQAEDDLECQPSPGGLAAALTPIQKLYNAAWVGWAGIDRPISATQRQKLQIPKSLHIVDILPADYTKYYYGVANGVLWPMLHGLAAHKKHSPQDWQTYLKVNQLFANKIKRLARPNDIIWVHDYHLLALPGLLRQAGLTNKVGFFLHPSVANHQLLQTMPNWRHILTSLAAADLCAVQTKRDLKNLKLSFKAMGITPPRMDHLPIGIDYQAYHKAVQQAACGEEQKRSGKKLIFSISRLDHNKGILDQLMAIDKLLSDNPNLNIVYKLVVSPSREGLQQYRNLKLDIDHLVKQINQRHPGLVDYEYRNYPFNEVVATYRSADVLLITPLIDGMNLITKEYIAAREQPGVLVLSNTTGAAQQLTQALQTDPQNIGQIAAALKQALEMPAAEKQKRWQALQHNIKTQDVFHWADSFLKALTQKQIAKQG